MTPTTNRCLLSYLRKESPPRAATSARKKRETHSATSSTGDAPGSLEEDEPQRGREEDDADGDQSRPERLHGAAGAGDLL